jgi:hypothetical protein
MSRIGRLGAMAMAVVALSPAAFAITVGTTDTFTGSLDN